MKRRDPSNDRTSEAARSLRAQLSRAVGGSLDALEGRLRNRLRAVLTNGRPVEVSKQRLSDVLWNDRTLLATHATAGTTAASDAAPPAPAPPLEAPPARVEAVQAAPLPPPEPIAPLPAGIVGPRPQPPPVVPEVAQPAVAAPLPAPDDDDDGWQEPIRTRSMARLLAGQGHRARALAIYDALLAADATDASLRAEADALRQASV